MWVRPNLVLALLLSVGRGVHCAGRKSFSFRDHSWIARFPLILHASNRISPPFAFVDLRMGIWEEWDGVGYCV